MAKPRRLPSTRRALSTDELTEINIAARTSGNDPILDALILRFHTETAARRSGALSVQLAFEAALIGKEGARMSALLLGLELRACLMWLILRVS